MELIQDMSAIKNTVFVLKSSDSSQYFQNNNGKSFTCLLDQPIEVYQNSKIGLREVLLSFYECQGLFSLSLHITFFLKFLLHLFLFIQREVVFLTLVQNETYVIRILLLEIAAEYIGEAGACCTSFIKITQ